jgi:hypothetical protein
VLRPNRNRHRILFFIDFAQLNIVFTLFPKQPYNCTQKFLGLGTVLGAATQNSTHTQNPTFSGFDTQTYTHKFWVFISNTIPNTHNFWVYNCVNYVKYYPYTQTVAPKSFGYEYPQLTTLIINT